MILIGDIKIHVDNRIHTVNFMETLDCFNLIQHINFPTHSKGHILDLVRTAGAAINQLEGKDLCISDSKLLSFNLCYISKINFFFNLF